MTLRTKRSKIKFGALGGGGTERVAMIRCTTVSSRFRGNWGRGGGETRFFGQLRCTGSDHGLRWLVPGHSPTSPLSKIRFGSDGDPTGLGAKRFKIIVY